MANYMTIPGAIAGGDLSTNQFYAVQLSTALNNEVIAITATANRPIGILQNNPNTSGQAAEVAIVGVCKAQFGGTVGRGDPLGVSAAGRLVTIVESSTGGTTGLYKIAYALYAGTATGVGMVRLGDPNIGPSATA